ncbi:Protein ANTAGONIST OF LIKE HETEROCHROMATIN PROTEIN 1 [Frankliniella fusca]|uniref:Protein ANTAGONIST OF LIKE HETEROCHROMATIN PROTEIN 1 n=1 Tax=Frankliniella fusca TaxID=407009 RepID=A0AAE1HA39_9NEOP|nr:Protein ANTAGONIST OF LIKE HETEROCHROMATIN PROTEIN 1 [Frankliniella fusca]
MDQMERARRRLVLLNRVALGERLALNHDLPRPAPRVLGRNFKHLHPAVRLRLLRRMVVAERLRHLLEWEEAPRRQRRWVVRPTFQMRSQWGAWYTKIPFMKEHDEELFFNFLRVTPAVFDELLAKVRPHLERRNIPSRIEPGERLALTLRYLASGDSQKSLSYEFLISPSTISGIVLETCNTLWDVLVGEVFIVPSAENFATIAHDFETIWNFPNAIGALDGRHCEIQNFPGQGTDYFNYQSYFSMVLLAMCDAKYKFTFVDIGGRGRRSDGGLFRHSALGRQFYAGEVQFPGPRTPPGWMQPLPHVIIGDEAFALNYHLMIPFGGNYLSDEKNIFNYRLSRARKVIENAFGIMTARFRILRRCLVASEPTVRAVISAVVVLHNYLVLNEENLPADRRRYLPEGFADHEQNGHRVPGRWRAEAGGRDDLLQPVRHPIGVAFGGEEERGYGREEAEVVQRQFCDYFLSPQGRVPWQWRHLLRR